VHKVPSQDYNINQHATAQKKSVMVHPFENSFSKIEWGDSSRSIQRQGSHDFSVDSNDIPSIGDEVEIIRKGLRILSSNRGLVLYLHSAVVTKTLWKMVSGLVLRRVQQGHHHHHQGHGF